MSYVNERATAAWVSTLIGRSSGVEIGSVHPGRLYVAEIIDHSRTEILELGERAIQWTSYRPGPFRERVS